MRRRAIRISRCKRVCFDDAIAHQLAIELIEGQGARRDYASRSSQATISQMESDLAALNALKSQVLARVQELTAPEEKIERVRLADFFDDSLDSEEAIEEAVAQLREHLLKLLAEGVRIVLE